MPPSTETTLTWNDSIQKPRRGQSSLCGTLPDTNCACSANRAKKQPQKRNTRFCVCSARANVIPTAKRRLRPGTSCWLELNQRRTPRKLCWKEWWPKGNWLPKSACPQEAEEVTKQPTTATTH